MIAIQKIGRSFMGALDYNIKKGNHPDKDKRAVLLATNFSSLTPERIKAEVDLLRAFRPNLNRYVYHTSLNFSKEEIQPLTNAVLTAIAEDYLNANGFNNNQYLIFRHHDADHPHIHLLANRITFDGKVVSDSNNYKKSEEIVRQLEERYNLQSVEPSNKAAQKAPKADEIEMAIRKGRPSDKMFLQENLKSLIRDCPTVTELIRRGEKIGVYFLFNQASTGRVSGVTYFINDFKIKGQALGNQFKWAELIKKIDYEQIRDSQTIGEANERTRTIYGANNLSGEQGSSLSAEQANNNRQRQGYRATQLPAIHSGDLDIERIKSTGADPAGEEAGNIKSVDQNADHHEPDYYDFRSAGVGNSSRVEISDDIDDEAIHGRNRRRKDMPRTNRR